MAHSGANHMVATLIMRTIFIINDAFNELAKLLKIAENLLRNENLLTEVILGDNTQMLGLTATEYFTF